MGSVEQVAAEVGIPPDQVRAAAAEIRGSSSAVSDAELTRRIATEPALPLRRTPKTFPRAPDVKFAKERLTAERSVEGEMPMAAFPEAVDIIQEEFDLVGHVSTVGRTLTWSPARQGTESRQIVVTIRPREGVTELHVEEQIELAGWRIFAPGWGAGAGAIFGLAVGAMLGFQEGAILFTALPSAVFGAFATVKGMINHKAIDASPQLQRVLDRLGALVRSHPSAELTPSPN